MVNLLIPDQDRSLVSYGCASHGSQISPLRVLFLKIMKIFCPSEVPSKNSNISEGCGWSFMRFEGKGSI